MLFGFVGCDLRNWLPYTVCPSIRDNGKRLFKNKDLLYLLLQDNKEG